MERERLGSRLGFILIAAGCAIGLGNIWKFPYMVGQYGGGAFVLIYLVFLVILGVPLLSVELLIESYGTGIRKIYNLYANCSEQPRIEVTSNTFKIILPNMNRATAKESGTGITAQMQKILDYIDENGKITDLEIQDLLGLKKTRAFTLAKQMRDYGLIKVVGRGSEKVYVK